MLIKKPSEIAGSEITDPKVYLSRRRFIRLGILAASTAATGWVYEKLSHSAASTVTVATLDGVVRSSASGRASGFWTDEPQNSLQEITHYNNFYEFSSDKNEVADLVQGFSTRPWTVSVEGLVRRPKVFDIDELLKISPPEERVYRMRCVEGWSMVIPWDGFSLSKLLDRVEPYSAARFVQFQTLMDPGRLPNQHWHLLPWPYVEGLRMDEAMHPLTILATGIYGRELPVQDGAPVRLIVPWKYGFKGAKSLVSIKVTSVQPANTWSVAAPEEYGFYANVNPNVPHPRWSQAMEQRLPGLFKDRPTLMFNGYGEQVAGLYAGMDLKANF